MLHKTTDIDVKLIILYVGKASNIFYHTVCVCVCVCVCVSWQFAKGFEQIRDKSSLGE